MAERYLSGIQASGVPHLGNYLGALKYWVEAQTSSIEVFSMVADLHAITTPPPPEVLLSNRNATMSALLAIGLDPSKSTLFFQSQIRAHTEIAWLIGSQAYYGELQRMRQFQTKSSETDGSVTLDLFAYPVLQAADILAYDATGVPVGNDQLQHIELTRNIASRINQKYGDVLVVPNAITPPEGARIMDLQKPNKKMSKSNSVEAGIIFLTDSNDEIQKKFKRAVTDSKNLIVYDDDQPGVKNLIEIASVTSGKNTNEVVSELEGKGYGQLKSYAADAVINLIEPIRERIARYMSDPNEVSELVADSKLRATEISENTLNRLKSNFGFN